MNNLNKGWPWGSPLFDMFFDEKVDASEKFRKISVWKMGNSVK